MGLHLRGEHVGWRRNVIQPLLQAASINMLRYGGGSYADYYDWQTNTNIQNCLPDDATASFASSCASSDSLNFSQFSQQARAIGAQSFVTVNYGSGTPAEAAAWVAQAKSTPGQGVALWEVGNETYGCWEVDNELAGPPENFAGYTPNTYTTVNGVYENPTARRRPKATPRVPRHWQPLTRSTLSSSSSP